MGLDEERPAGQQADEPAWHPMDVDGVVPASTQASHGGQVEEDPDRQRQRLGEPGPPGAEVGEPDVVDVVAGAAKDLGLNLGHPRDVVHERDSRHAPRTPSC